MVIKRGAFLIVKRNAFLIVNRQAAGLGEMIMKVSSVKEMWDLDRRAIAEFSIAEEILMENAGEAVYSVILKETGISGKSFSIFCGTGNNGGDGLVVARKLYSMGCRVTVFILGDCSGFTGAAGKNLEIAVRMAVEIKEIKSAEAAKAEVMHSDIIIDGIFGTGLTREVGGLYKDVISLINSSGKKIVSIDMPSGINGDTGEEMGIAVAADYTVAFGLAKRGNLLFPGFKNCGKLYLSHISFPPALHSDNSIKVEINSPSEIPERDRNGHKGNFGDVLFIAGAANYYGAPYFCAYSFLKAGGGYSRLAAPVSIIPFIAAKGSEIVFLPQEETEEGSIALSNKAKLLELSEKVDMVVIGPGLSLQQETRKLVKELAAAIVRPLLLDGDGITAISEDLKILKERKAPTVITPHLGEMARIVQDSPVAEIDKNKVSLVQKWASELNTIIVLKGGHSLIGYPEGRVLINLSGNSGMATAGSGDVLCGTIAAAFGLGLPLAEAAGTAVFLHGLAGDLAASVHGEDGITARDILEYLPESLLYYRNHGKEIRQGFNSKLYLI